MSISLKHIPCPAGANCSAYKCLFGGHPGDNDGPASSAAGAVYKDEVGLSGNDSDTTGPWKARRLDSPRQTTSRNALNPSTSRPVPPGGERNPASSLLHSIRRPISPPPNRRAVDIIQATNSSTPAEPAKQESLNPRLLKESPATHELRLKLSKMLHTEYKRLNDKVRQDSDIAHHRLILSDQAMIKRVLDEEEAVAIEKKAVYSNVMKNTVMKYKRFRLADWIKEREKEMPASKKRQRDVMEGNVVIVQTGLTSAQEVQLLHRLRTPIDDLGEYGYTPETPSDEAIAKSKDGLAAAHGWEQCDRCNQRFEVFAGRREGDGALASGGACNFHWGKTYFPEKSSTSERGKQAKHYLCCSEQVGDSVGCISHPNHVFKVSDSKRLAVLLNFMATPENAAVPADRAVCFDCEMGYTVHGMELIRLTATSWPDGAEILDVLVRPFGEILDLNSRFSGVWPNDIALAEAWHPGDPLVPPPEGSVTGSTYVSGSEDAQVSRRKLKIVPSPAVARDLLFSLIAPSTPLIGHGLENDLNAVRVIHPTLIDTVLTFPHKNGLPYRQGLKQLMSTHLNRQIQVQHGPKMEGHDSAEDARAAGELVRFRVAKEWADMKRRGWKVVDGELVAPPAAAGSGEGRSSNNSEGGGGGGALTEAFIEGDKQMTAD
ncbi:Ribonuclease H-like protein [Cordyceps fumosorosea ARSEF 2679]|uniref:Ribonuclease H-like protein n=1 Tax=Cordyceps fumosorosea (strain ARSEF 2679) TaxID=1081104 RepID=A0A167PN73_CORFA|nr:Ribonuclease H-like protein [Cordyceps fumosorosea ARSEF 2679]OAA56844.1 Ribonuclease H-like protein [Cordyceps fumosorosea ARSEF 2679]